VSEREFIPNPVEHRPDGTTVLLIDYESDSLGILPGLRTESRPSLKKLLC